ncbi:MAG: hypothetical protein HQ488_04520 [Parcubacteria group bacterium]|nr:hypothetical protein [Parcubacteria group bacterium]
MSTVEDVANKKEIQYQVNTTAGLIIGFVAVLAVFLMIFGMAFVSGDFSRENIVLYLVLGLFGLVVLSSIRNILHGLRMVKIIGNEVVLEYKEKTEHVPVSEISSVNTMRFKDKNKNNFKGVVYFKVYQETKKGLTFNTHKPGGLEAFEWFERLQKSQKEL